MSMKVKTDTSSRARNRVFGVLIALGVIVVVCIITAISSMETRRTISVVKIKNDNPVSSNAMITSDMVEEYDMYYKEFEQYGTVTFSDKSTKKAIVTWADKDAVIGKRYAAYYLRGGTVLFWDSTIKEQTKKNSYLYSMDGELINIQMDTSDFGNMVVPGDIINIRASYIDLDTNLPSEEAYKLSIDENKDGGAVEVTKNVKLFSEASVLDMLNSDGQSIFDIYYEYISMSKAQQSACLQDKDWLASVKPKSVLLEVTSEEADRFMKISAKSPTYLMTLCPRTGTNSIIDSLSDIQSALSGTQSTSQGKDS